MKEQRRELLILRRKGPHAQFSYKNKSETLFLFNLLIKHLKERQINFRYENGSRTEGKDRRKTIRSRWTTCAKLRIKTNPKTIFLFNLLIQTSQRTSK